MTATHELASTVPGGIIGQPAWVARTTWRNPEPRIAASSGRPGVRLRPVVPAERVFAALAERWRRETAPLSSATDIALHPAYQRIIGMGQAALPLILAELERAPDHWFWALRAITNENPVTEEDAGDLGRMRDAWVRLARARGWLR